MADLAAPFLAAPASAAVLTDFDGTLAPIVTDPERARPLAGAVDVLESLARRYAVVGVISGRPVAYLQRHLGTVPGLLLAGLYGLERMRDGRINVLDEAAAWQQAIERAAAAADRSLPPGVLVERKGLAVTFHFRTAPGEGQRVASFAALQAGESGLVAHPGRQSVELRPPVTADKGTVVADLATGRAAVCYLGDDAGDLPAFAALAGLRAQGTFTAAVAVTSAEAPPGLVEAADLAVEGPAGALRFLAALLPS